MSNRVYVVTGAAGFIGDRLARDLAQKGNQVIGVDALAHFETRVAEHAPIAGMQKVDREKLIEWLPGKKLDGIFHLGACTDTTELDIAYLNRVNVEYSQNLWNYCTKNSVPLVYASSAATYGGGEFGYDDDESLMSRLKPLNPYGDSKLIFDLWALDQEKAHSAPPAWSGFKFFNVYGFGERHKGKMSSVVIQSYDQIQAQGATRLFRSHKSGIADGEQKRDFILVDDVIRVLQFAMQKPIRRGIYNLGTGQARTFLDLTRATFKALKKPEAITFIDTPISIRDRYQYFTEARMQKLSAAGYTEPFTSLESGVARYIEQLSKN